MKLDRDWHNLGQRGDFEPGGTNAPSESDPTLAGRKFY